MIPSNQFAPAKPPAPPGCRWPMCRCIPQKINGKEKGLCH